MALKPITRQEQIIAGKNLEPITRMERFLKEYGGGSGGSSVQSDWNQNDSSAADFIKNKPFAVANMNWETMMLDVSLSEIDNIIISGGAVLFSATMTPIMVSSDENGPTGATSTVLAGMDIENDTPTLIVQRFSFASDGSLAGIDMAIWSGGTLVPV